MVKLGGKFNLPNWYTNLANLIFTTKLFSYTVCKVEIPLLLDPTLMKAIVKEIEPEQIHLVLT